MQKFAYSGAFTVYILKVVCKIYFILNYCHLFTCNYMILFVFSIFILRYLFFVFHLFVSYLFGVCSLEYLEFGVNLEYSWLRLSTGTITGWSLFDTLLASLHLLFGFFYIYLSDNLILYIDYFSYKLQSPYIYKDFNNIIIIIIFMNRDFKL